MHKAYICLFIFLSQIVSPTCAAHPNLIKSVIVDHNIIKVEPSDCCAEKYFTFPEFIIEYDQSINLSDIATSVASIPFIVCIAPSIWLAGDNYTIDELDADLFYTLKRIKKIFTIFYPQFKWNGNIVPQRLVYNRTTKPVSSDETALLFSGGLDSTTLSFALKDYKQLLLTVQGIDIPFDDTARWQNIQKANTSFAQSFGHTNAFIRFNGCKVIDYYRLSEISESISKWWWWDYILGSMGFIGVTVPLLYQKGYKAIQVASTKTISYPYPWNTHPLIDNNLCFAGIRAHHRHEELTRLAKVQSVTQHLCNYELSIPFLRVCWRDKQGGNCCNCVNKCLLTMHDILVEGYDYQSFGFPVSFSTLQETTRKAFDGTKTYSNEIIDDWCDVQQRILQRLDSDSDDDFYSPEVRLYLLWLAELCAIFFRTTRTVHCIS